MRYFRQELRGHRPTEERISGPTARASTALPDKPRRDDHLITRADYVSAPGKMVRFEPKEPPIENADECHQSNDAQAGVETFLSPR
jgi:hypothetical protein